jgi:hypothetical protein
VICPARRDRRRARGLPWPGPGGEALALRRARRAAGRAERHAALPGRARAGRRTRAALLGALALGCGAHAATAPTLRLITGDATAIANDWTANENGARFPVVKDGTPARPWISTAHAFGARSLAFMVPTDLSGHKQRVEYKLARAGDPDGLHFDNGRYAGFAFKLDGAPAPFLGSAIFWQAWQGNPWGPPVALKVAKGSAPPYRVRLTVRNSATGPSSTDPDVEIWSGAVLTPNVWSTFLIHVQPRFDGGGRVELWIDGARVLDWIGPIGYDPARVPGALDGLDVKIGIYQPDANNGHTFYFDQISFAGTYAAAAAQLGW